MSFYLQHAILYEGKAKILFESDRAGTFIQYFKDSLTAFNAQKRTEIAGKGEINSAISAHIMKMLARSFDLRTHYVEQIDRLASYIHVADVMPLEFVVRNYFAGASFVKRARGEVGTKLPRSICEISLKDDTLGDPLISEDQVIKFGLASRKHFFYAKKLAMRINDILSAYLLARDIILADMKLEFGIDESGVLLVDEISPDTCRLWDIYTGNSMDKDVFRFQTDDRDIIMAAYKAAAARILEN